MSLKPWREVIVPHPDVLKGTFQQSEFAADLTAVRTGRATPEYGDAKSFYERTFITEGMGKLLTQVAQRLNGKGGEPVIQLQTSFGGGKTHTMLAVYHLANRQCALGDLSGIPALLDHAGVMDVPTAKVAVLDGTAHAPGQAWKQGKQAIHTLWGEMAWQLGGAEGFALVQEADANGTSPGKDVLCTLLTQFAPCVVLLDELVVYIRQFVESQALSGGTYDSNLSFIQSLTEAAKLVPNAVVLASLPESNSQAGGPRGVAALQSLEAVFNRVQALWKTVAPEEAFEIVRRRLFESIRDAKARDLVCRAFADAYVAEGAKVPQETQEARYFDRMMQSYPIHPEVFTQLYEEWTTIDGFQRTRGVLKLMAKVIYRLWQDNNKDLMILPGSLPLYDGSARNELVYYLGPGWDPVIDRDIDGERAETTVLETKETRFGSVQAARRVARTVFLGSAPSSVTTRPGIRGLDRARVLLGCLQPGQTSSLYSDALNRLADQLHSLNSSGDTRQHILRAHQFLLGLVRLKIVQRQSICRHIVHDGAPGQCHPNAIAQSGQRTVIRRKEKQTVAAIAGRGAVALYMLKHAINGSARLFARVELFRRQHDQAQRTVIRHIAVRGEDMRAIEKTGAVGELLEDFGHPPTHFILVLKALLPLFHFAPQIGTGVEPIACRLLRLVAGRRVQVV